MISVQDAKFIEGGPAPLHGLLPYSLLPSEENSRRSKPYQSNEAQDFKNILEVIASIDPDDYKGGAVANSSNVPCCSRVHEAAQERNYVFKVEKADKKEGRKARRRKLTVRGK